MANLSLKGLHKAYAAHEVIRGIDLEIQNGEFVCFLGPSGCGKSTLLRMIAGLEEITSGDFLINDQIMTDVSASKRGVAMVFQSYALYPHMTVRQNMEFGLKLAKLSHAEIEIRIQEAARILQIEPLLDRKPKALSGGQRQRVAIGRAIVRQPKVFLLDEPLSNLDSALRVSMRIELARLHEDLAATMIYVTHDQIEAMTLADRVVVMRDGFVEQFGTPLELFHKPANKFVASFIGTPKMNFFDVEVIDVSGDRVTVTSPSLSTALDLEVPLAPSVAVGDSLSMGVRPHRLSVADPKDCQLLGKVQLVEHLGSESLIYLETSAKEQVICSQTGVLALSRGHECRLGLAAENCLLFDATGKALPRNLPPDVGVVFGDGGAEAC